MDRAAANGYVLTLSLLVAAYVRHLEDDDYEKQQAESSLLSADADADRALERKTVARASVAALAQFLLAELQRPRDAVGRDAELDREREPTSLQALFARLQRALRARPEDATVLCDEVLHVLATVDSPDAVSDVVDAIGECVAPRALEPQGDGDAANALLVRTSVFGVFVRRFVLAVNRLLFDGLSRVFDEVSRYRDEYVDHQLAMRRSGTGTEGQSDISLSLTASPTSRFLWKQGDDMDDLPLSPIVGASSQRDRADSSQFNSLTLPATQDEVMADGGYGCGNGVSSQDVLATAAPTPAPLPALSRDQTQYLLHDTVQELGHGLTLPLIGSTTARLLEPLQHALDPDALFVKYLDAVNCREYESALEALHQYHDVALSRTQHFRHALRARNKAASAGASTTDPAGISSSSSAGSGLHFLGSGVQYAALNLAGLHIAFDRFDAAQDSIQEAIRVSQHHGDHICVAFALSWLARVQLMQGNPRQQVSALIASALERAEELSIPSLRVLVSLTALEHELTLGGSAAAPLSSASSLTAVSSFPSPRPLDLWSRLSEVDQIVVDMGESVGSSSVGTGTAGRTLGNLMNMQQQQQQLQQGGPAGVARSDSKKTSGMTWTQSVEAVLHSMWSLQGKSRAAAAIGWQLYGARALGDAFDNVFWTAYKDSASSNEIASWISRMVFARVEWSAHVDEDGSSSDDPAGQIQFVGAFQSLRDVLRQPELQRHQLLRRSKVLQRTIHHVLALWCMHRGEFALADAYISQLKALSSSSSDLPARVEARLLQSRLWGETEQYLRCFQELGDLEALCRERGYEYVQAQVLILQSDYTRRSRAPHSPFDALPMILQAIQICQSNRYDLLLAEAHLVIAEIYIAMGKLADVVQLLDQQMPLVMEHGSIQLRAESLLVLAKATLAQTDGSDQDPISPRAAPRAVDDRVIEWLDDSAALFTRLESWRKLREIAFLKTRTLHATGNAATSEAAKEFLHYEQLLHLAQQRQSVTTPVIAVDSVNTLTRIIQDRRLTVAP